MERDDLYVGQYVFYVPSHGREENGIVKSITEHGVFVVYNCGGDWENYQDYTAANTNPRDLRFGWVNEKKLPEPK